MSYNEPITDPMCISPPVCFQQRPCYVQDGITNTYRLMHDPPDPDYARWYDTSGKYRRPVEPGPRVTEGNEVMYLVRGEETYEQMVAAIRSAHGNLGTKLPFIYLLGWDLSKQSMQMEMVPGDKTSSLEELLKAAHSTGTEIRAMLYANGAHTIFNAASTQWAVNNINGLNSSSGNSKAICDNKTRVGKWKHIAQYAHVGAHHQKVLIVNGTYGLMAFCGGVDIDDSRLDFVKTPTYLGWQDVHCRVRGPGAHFLLWIFRQRWRDHDEGKPVKLSGDDPSIDAKKNDPIDKCYVQIGRTFPVRQFTTSPPYFPGYSFALKGEQTVKQMILKAISEAKSFIYMEDQYLFSMEISNALKNFIKKDSARFLLILIEPDGGIDVELFGTEKPHRAEFINNLKNAPGGDKVLVFDGPRRYVHSKIYLFDDKMAIIGSANCNRRGMEHDSEVTAGIYDDPGDTGPAYHFCHRLRMRLWADHLNLADAKTFPNRPVNTDEDYAEVADPLGAIAHFLKEWPGRRIIPYVPDPNLGGGWNHPKNLEIRTLYTPQEAFDQLVDPEAPLG